MGESADRSAIAYQRKSISTPVKKQIKSNKFEYLEKSNDVNFQKFCRINR